MQLRASDLAAALDGTLAGPDTQVDGASIDSRAIGPGQLFVPIRAERDGHDFIADARRAGAAGYLTTRDHEGGTAIVVEDTTAALLDAGRLARRRLPGQVVGITGSVGKTSTKDLLAAVLATTLRTTASERSFNNELGVPLTLLNAPDGTEAAVVEMGARGPGHIELLCSVADPTIGVVTRVAPAHTAEFGGVEAIARAKGELVEALPPSGHAVLNGADPLVAAMTARAACRVLTFGVGDVVAESVELDDDLRARFRLRTPVGCVDVRLSVSGAHMVDNALAAAAAATAMGLPAEAIAAGLSEATLSPWRMSLVRLASGARVINDAYNANPTSVEAALRALAALPAERRIAVLGPMAELDDSDAQHARIGALARDLGIRVIAVAAPGYGDDEVAGVDEALTALGELGARDAVVVKGSRVARLEVLVERLVAGPA